MKPVCIIISDLWGKRKCDWWNMYIDGLNETFQVLILDSTRLADIESSTLSESELHNKFLTGGLDKAVDHILRKYKKVHTVIGISIGGVITWKAMLQGLSVSNFIGISATRLRYEVDVPESNISLYYGSQDPYRPAEDWASSLDLTMSLLPSFGHDIYKDKNFVSKLVSEIVRTKS